MGTSQHLPGMMTAAYVEATGPAETITIGSLPVPRPGPTDALVAVRASTVNPVDTFVRSGAYRTAMTFPFVIGRDLVGSVVEVGSGAAGFVPGQLVWCNSLGHGGRQGAIAEYAVVPADRLYPLPHGVDPLTAVAAVHPAATAHLALFHHAGLRAGETVYVGGGGGNVGSALIELASAAGARVVASAREGDFAHCRDRGAGAVVDYRDPELPGRLREEAPAGVDVYVDTSGQHDLDLALEVLAFGGRVVLLAGMDSRPELPVGAAYLKDASVTGFAISHASVTDLARAATRLNQLLARGGLAPRAMAVRPITGAARAHADVEEGRTHGRRVVLAMRDPGEGRDEVP